MQYFIIFTSVTLILLSNSTQAQFAFPAVENARSLNLRGKPKTATISSSHKTEKQIFAFNEAGQLISSNFIVEKNIEYRDGLPFKIKILSSNNRETSIYSISKYDKQGNPLVAQKVREDDYTQQKDGAATWNYKDNVILIREYDLSSEKPSLIYSTEIFLNQSLTTESITQKAWVPIGDKKSKIEGRQIFTYEKGVLISIRDGQNKITRTYTDHVLDACKNWIRRAVASPTTEGQFESWIEIQSIEYFSPCPE